MVSSGFAGESTRFTKGLFDKGLHAFDVRMGTLLLASVSPILFVSPKTSKVWSPRRVAQLALDSSFGEQNTQIPGDHVGRDVHRQHGTNLPPLVDKEDRR